MGCVYIPPKPIIEVYYDHCEIIQNTVSNNLDYKFIIFGEFNILLVIFIDPIISSL